MKKICIITMYGNWNYGNKLQNYALQEVLKKMDLDVISLKNNYQEKIITKIKNDIYKFRTRNIRPSFKDRKKNFKKFNLKYMKYTNYSVTYSLSKKKSKYYDNFIIGSDQVWNYGQGTISKIMFGLFAPKEKVISYSASFGVSEIPNKYIKMYIKGLSNISKISVRETTGANIVKKLINVDATVTLDPTLLLSKEDWLKLEIKPEFLNSKRFVLTYFLGKLSEKKQAEIKRVAQENNAIIINLNNYNEKQFFDIGPSEFLYLFHNSLVVFTDSFHACVFSMIFNKPFFVYSRDENVASMNSRIIDLLGEFKQQDRYIYSLDKMDRRKILQCNYKNFNNILKQKQKESLQFLKESLK